MTGSKVLSLMIIFFQLSCVLTFEFPTAIVKIIMSLAIGIAPSVYPSPRCQHRTANLGTDTRANDNNDPAFYFLEFTF
jgi:hypothetical protein